MINVGINEGQLYGLSRIIMLRDNLVVQCRSCVVALLEGYHHHIVFKTLTQFVFKSYHIVGDTSRVALWPDIRTALSTENVLRNV
jgi:hypothetical protein